MSWRELPVGIESLDELARLLNERFADDDPRDWNAAGARVQNVGAPRSPGDALSLAEADRRYLKLGWRPVISEQAAVAPATTPQPPTGPIGEGSITQVDVVLGASPETITAADGATGAILIVAVQQNSTADGGISWGTNFRFQTIVTIAPDPDAWTVFTFAWVAGEWTLLCLPYQHP